MDPQDKPDTSPPDHTPASWRGWLRIGCVAVLVPLALYMLWVITQVITIDRHWL